MIKTILGIVGLIVIGTIFLMIFCACVLSGKISEEERKNDRKSK